MSRLAVVTGGTRGIGAAIAVMLKEKGYEVIANYASNDERANAFKEETGVHVMKWNVADFDACQKAVSDIKQQFGKAPGILVNNAGITRDGMLHKASFENWKEVIDTNLSSCFNMCKAAVSDMRENKFGRIVNISSINGLTGQLGQTNYAAAKAGMIGFTKALAREGAFKNITANVIAPGYIKTEMTDAVPQEFMDKIIAQIPVGRLGLPGDIARTVVFLADDDAGFITGETISVNGGHNMV